DLMKYAREDCIILHCLPATRGYEITSEIMDSPNSCIFQEAENRLHTAKALLLKLLG
ncbi:ornithine carbamoyltransferase, partial [Candidatus Bathyarchaeota archaeon]|nr:ornithine carbamoyltransferase [Candidatus Bathyarchaeota archaeon]